VTRPAKSADWEMELVMPLGVVANQLVKIEGELRFLSMKAAEYSGEDGLRPTKMVDARLELIFAVLESIQVILAKVQADIHPKEPSTQFTTGEPAVSTRKPPPEIDD
jgi:hypothetical protein